MATAGAPPRAARPVPGAARADVESLLHSWIAAGGPGHGDARSRIAREIVALGGAGMDVVLAWLISGTDAESDAAAEILPGFGAAAIAPLVARLDDADAHVRERAAMGIRWFGPLLRDPALGASVCRVLVARFRDPAMRLLTDYEWRKTMDLSLRVHAAELAAVWAAGDGDASDDAGRALVLLGSDAAPALPAAVEILRRGDPDRRGLALLVLSACAGADAEQFADVASLLDSDDPGVRRAVAPLIPRWGEVPDDVVQRLAALLDDVQESDGNTVRTGALSAFAQLPGAAAAHLSAIVAATAAEDTGWDDELPSAVDRLCADPTCRAALVRLLPTLAGSGRTIVAAALRESATLDERLADADPEGRAFALDEFEESKAAPSPEVLALLDDPDAAVRAQAARIVAYRNGAAAERIRAVAIPLLANENMTTRGDAMAALAALSPEDGDAFARVLSALTGEDAGLAAAAMAGLAIRDAPIPGDHAAVVNSIERRLTDCTPRSNGWEWDDARAVLRFDGGSQALVRAAAAQLSRFKEWRNTFASDLSFHGSRVLAAIIAAGPAAASLHAALQDLWRTKDWDSRTFADALAATASDADEIAKVAAVEPATAHRLVAIGPAGLAALPLLVQRADEATRDPLLAALTGLPLDEVVVAAARVADDAPDAIVLREGAAVLARLVAPERAVPLLVELAASPYQDVRVAAIRSLIFVETRHAGAVPIEDVAHILSTAKFDARGWALRLAGRPGPRGAPLVPELQRIRAEAERSWDDRLLAGAALRGITGDAEEVLVVVRAALTITDLHLFFGDDWDDDDEPTVFGDLAQTIDWSGPRRELLLPVFARAGMSKVQRELLPVISRLGPDAAPFVPALRFALSDSEHTMNFSIGSGLQPAEPGEPILRTLASIGAAARVAIPDIRRWMAVTTDPNKVARDAIATIQSAPR